MGYDVDPFPQDLNDLVVAMARDSVMFLGDDVTDGGPWQHRMLDGEEEVSDHEVQAAAAAAESPVGHDNDEDADTDDGAGSDADAAEASRGSRASWGRDGGAGQVRCTQGTSRCAVWLPALAVASHCVPGNLPCRVIRHHSRRGANDPRGLAPAPVDERHVTAPARPAADKAPAAVVAVVAAPVVGQVQA